MTNSQKSYIFAGITIIFWSTIPSAFKLALSEVNIFSLLFVSIITSFFILFISVFIQKKISVIFHLSLKDTVYSLALGIFNPFLYYVVIFNAYSLLPAQIAHTINFIWPIVLVLLSIPILKSKISFKILMAMFISFSGVVFISAQGKMDFSNWANLKGISLALTSTIIWCLFWLFNVRDKKEAEIKLFLNFFASAVIIILYSFLFKEKISLSTKGLVYSIYIGCFEMGFAFIFWMKALEYAESTDKVSNLIYLTPFLSLIVIHFVLGEKIFLTTFIGLVLIITGILFQQYLKKKFD
ncbi:DMT family transporter [Bacteroidota bacterium]